MRLIRSAGLLLLFAALGPAWTTAQAADPPAVAALKKMGLSRSGRTVVHEAEGPVLATMKEARAASAGYFALADKQAAAEQAASHLTQLEERRGELQDGLNDLNQRIIEQGNQLAANAARLGRGGAAQGGLIPEMIARRDQVQIALAEVTLEQKSLKVQSTPSQDRVATDEDLKKKGEAVRAALAELRPLVDEVTRKYATLGADPSARAAINDLETASKVDLKLGPSDAFLAGVKALDQAERRLLGKKATVVPRKKARSKK